MRIALIGGQAHIQSVILAVISHQYVREIRSIKQCHRLFPILFGQIGEVKQVLHRAHGGLGRTAGNSDHIRQTVLSQAADYVKAASDHLARLQLFPVKTEGNLLVAP